MLDGGLSDPARTSMAGHISYASCGNETDRSHRAGIPGVYGVRITLRHAGLRNLFSPIIDDLATIDYGQFSAPVALPLPQAGSGVGPRPRRASRPWQQRLAPVRGRLAHRPRQCVTDRRFATVEELRTQTTAWHEQRNARQRMVDWQFKVDDARVKLKSIYPKLEV